MATKPKKSALLEPEPKKKVAPKKVASPAKGGFKFLSDEEVKALNGMQQEQYFARKSKYELENGEHTLFMIPLADGEKPGAVETVNLNGYRLTIKKGFQVSIPTACAQIIAEKYQVQMLAGQEMLADRNEDTQSALG